MADIKLIEELIKKDKSTISFIYSKKENFGAFFSELFLYGKVKNLSENEIVLKLKCGYKSTCKIYITNNSVRLAFKKNYLGRFKFVNNEDILYFKATLGRKIIEVNLESEKTAKQFNDYLINSPDVYAELHEEKIRFLETEPIKTLFQTVKKSKLI